MVTRYRCKSMPWPDEMKYPQVLGRNYIWDGRNLTWVQTAPTYFPSVTIPYYAAEIWDETHPGPPYRTGGPLTILKREVPTGAFLSKGYDLVSANGLYRYAGKFIVIPLAMDPDYMDDVALTTYGPTGWNKFKPGKPMADVATFLGELRDFQHLFKRSVRKLSRLKKIANWNLAIQFQWLPTLNDLRKFYNTWDVCQSAIDRLRKYNGRYERRGGTVARNEDVTLTTSAVYWTPTLNSFFHFGGENSGAHSVPRYIRREYRVWFEAAFRYFIPDIGTKTWEDHAVRQLFGTKVTPSVVWNLLPWSWMVDWFSNLGDVLSNLDDGAVENLTAAYAFAMRHQRVVYDTSFTHTFNCKGGPVTVSANLFQKFEKKERAKVSPFEPGLTDWALSLRQLSILAALGITRFS